MSGHVTTSSAIGLGPFNLGLACLAEPIAGLDGVFLEAREEFRWHHGMMIEGATIQVPFLADLVTMADPTSRVLVPRTGSSRPGRLYPFYIRESFYPLRAEYDAYCRWAAARLPNLHWNAEVDRGRARRRGGRLRRGSCAPTPARIRARAASCSASARGRTCRRALRGLGGPGDPQPDYLTDTASAAGSGSITVVGSGQSAAEIYLDLLEAHRPHGYRLDWVTRSPRFFPMEYTKLTLEMTSPEYTDHFHGLPLATCGEQLGREQRSLYKGISGDLDRRHLRHALPQAGADGRRADDAAHQHRGDRPRSGTASATGLELRHASSTSAYERETESLVLATGYAAETPPFLSAPSRSAPTGTRADGSPSPATTAIDGGRGQVFVQNGEEHTHGLIAPDLGFGAWRNSSILARDLRARGLSDRAAHRVPGVRRAARTRASRVCRRTGAVR